MKLRPQPWAKANPLSAAHPAPSDDPLEAVAGQATNSTLHGMFVLQARRTPRAVAVIYGDEQLTYAQLDRRSDVVAETLLEAGARAETLVGLCAERSLEMVIGMLGILKAGAAYLPLDPSHPVDRLAFMLADSGAPMVLAQKHLLPRLPAGRTRVLSLEAEPSADEAPTKILAAAVSAASLAYVMYTSGSTGQPKAVMVEHGGVVNMLSDLNRRFSVSSDDRILALSSFSFDPSVYDVFGLLGVGGAIVIPEESLARQPAHWSHLLRKHGVTLWSSVPASMEMLFTYVANSGQRFPSLRVVWLGGDRIPLTLPDKIRQLNPTVEVASVGGNTEASICTFVYKIVTVDPTWTSIPYGRPMAHQSCHILDEELQPCAPGAAGQIYIGGLGVSRGYLNRPDLNAEKFIDDPFCDRPGARLFATGDLGRWRPDGAVEFLGRIDNQVKIRGYRVELGEIEAALCRHPDVREAVVVACGEASGHKSLAAFLVAASPPGPSTQDLRAFLRQALPAYMVPQRFALLDALPLTANQKVDRNALSALDARQFPPAAELVAGVDEYERRLIAIWEQVLDQRPLGAEDDFFALGGDSLSATALLVQIEQEFAVELSPDVLLDAPTVRRLSRYLREPATVRVSSIVTIRQTGARPLFCLAGIGGSLLEFRALFKALGPEQPIYGLRPRGLDGRQAPHDSIVEMAAYHLEDMRRVQPEGPYFLLGYSLGGIIAFEMARQLEAKNQTVALLALLDSKLTPPAQSLPLGQRLRMHCWYLLHSDPQGRRRYLQTRLRMLQARFQRRSLQREESDVLLGLNLTTIQRKVAEMHWRAARAYQPQIYHGPLDLFTASVRLDEPAEALADPSLGWSKWTASPIAIHKSPGVHSEMLSYANAPALARQIRCCLDRAHAQAVASTNGNS